MEAALNAGLAAALKAGIEEGILEAVRWAIAAVGEEAAAVAAVAAPAAVFVADAMANAGVALEGAGRFAMVCVLKDEAVRELAAVVFIGEEVLLTGSALDCVRV